MPTAKPRVPQNTEYVGSGCFICDVGYSDAADREQHRQSAEHLARFVQWNYEARCRMGFIDFRDDEAVRDGN